MAGSLEEALGVHYKFIIDNDLRTISIPNDMVFGVYNDRNVQTIDFEMPRYYHGDLDLSEFSIRINYITGGHGNIYLVLDKVATANKITFTWTVDIGAYLQNGGSVTFAVCLRKVDQNSEVTHEFNTTIHTVKVLEGLEVSPASQHQVLDYLTQIQQIIENLEDTAEQMAEDIAEEVRQSIPQDYSALSDEVDDLNSALDDITDWEPFTEIKEIMSFGTPMADTAGNAYGSTQGGYNPNEGTTSCIWDIRKPTEFYITGVQGYTSCVIIENPTRQWEQSGNRFVMDGDSAVRYRSSDSNLPSANNPYSTSNAIIILTTVSSKTSNVVVTTMKRVIPIDEQKENVVKCYGSSGLYIAEKVKSGYVVYDFNRFTSQANNADGWGIELAYLYDDNLSLVTNITTGGEWECAVHLKDRPDFSGLRAHGSEVYTNIKFLIDGKYYDESTISELSDWTGFQSIKIYETSQLYDPADEVTVIAEHEKVYSFENAKLTIRQKLKWLINDITTDCYLAMFPIAKAVTNYFVDNTNFAQKDISNDPRYSANDCKSVTLFSTGNQTADVCATFATGLYEADGTEYRSFFMTDNGGGVYNKCYYPIARNKAISVNEIWKTETFYEWQI